MATKFKFISYNACSFVLLRCFAIKVVGYSSFNVQKIDTLFVGDLTLGGFFNFCSFSAQRWDFQFAAARGSPTIVNDYVMTSQDYTKV